MMVGDIGVHRAHQAEFIRPTGGVRQVVGKLRTALSVRLERPWGGHDVAAFHDVVGQVLDKRLRYPLAMIFLHLRLRVKEIKLAGGSGHEDKDDLLGSRREMRLAGGVRVGPSRDLSRAPLERQQVRERDNTEAAGSLLKEPPPALDFN